MRVCEFFFWFGVFFPTYLLVSFSLFIYLFLYFSCVIHFVILFCVFLGIRQNEVLHHHLLCVRFMKCYHSHSRSQSACCFHFRFPVRYTIPVRRTNRYVNELVHGSKFPPVFPLVCIKYGKYDGSI